MQSRIDDGIVSPKASDPTDWADLADTYDRDGVVRLPGLLAPEWIGRILESVAEVRARRERGEDLGQVQCFTAPGRLTVRWMWREHADVRGFFVEAGVQDAVAAILRTPDLQYWYDLTFIHDAGDDSVGTPWHHDIAAFPFTGTKVPSLWIAMTDMAFDQAPLQCIRGSHLTKLRYRPPVYIDPNAPVPEGYAEMPDVAGEIAAGKLEVLQWEMAAGDALLIHPSTLHGAPPVQRAGGTRIAFSTRWAGDDVRWAPNSFSMPIPGMDYATVPVGERPSGPAFPYAPLSPRD